VTPQLVACSCGLSLPNVQARTGPSMTCIAGDEHGAYMQQAWLCSPYVGEVYCALHVHAQSVRSLCQASHQGICSGPPLHWHQIDYAKHSLCMPQPAACCSRLMAALPLLSLLVVGWAGSRECA
jgi:hypothetical protein